MSTISYTKSNLHDQTISKGSVDINALTKKVISNEKGYSSRILYAGPNFSKNGMVIFRIIELGIGNNFLEKVSFNSADKSIHSKLIYLQKSSFHKLVDPHLDEFNKVYRKSTETISSVSLYRGTDSGHIRTNLILDERKGCHLLSFYMYWRLRSYYRK